MFAEVIAVILAGACVTAYFERKSLKAESEKVRASSKAYFDAVIKAVRTKFTEDVAEKREQVAADIATIVDDVKTWEAKETVSAKEVIAQFEARIKQIL